MLKRIAILAAFAALTGCSVQSPDPGHEIVLVEKPYFFGHGGVDPEPVTTGRTFTAVSTSGVDVYMQPQKYEVDLPDIMTSDGVPLSFHSVITLRVLDSVSMIKTFGPDWYSNNVENPFKMIVRQAVRKHGMNETAISTTAVDAIDNEVHDNIIKLLTERKIPAEIIQISIGKANPPDAVKTQRIETASQQQRIQTEMQVKLAEDQRKAAETARAEADNAYRIALGLTSEQFIELQRINMLKSVCSTKDTCTFITGSVTPVLPVK